MDKTVKWQGKEVQGTEVGFDISREDWAIYHLKDGSTLRVKNTLVSVTRLNPEYVPPDEEVFYVVETNMVVRATDIPDTLKVKRGGAK